MPELLIIVGTMCIAGGFFFYGFRWGEERSSYMLDRTLDENKDDVLRYELRNLARVLRHEGENR